MKKIKILTGFILLLSIVAMGQVVALGSTRTVQTSGGNRNVAYVEIWLDSSYTIMGLTADNSLGRDDGTLANFASANQQYVGTNTIITPVNFFQPGTAGRPVDGGILSMGEFLVHSDVNIGFDSENRMHLRHYAFTPGEIADLNIQTGFFAFPALITEGEATSRDTLLYGGHTPNPSGAVNRAFMGQREDGSFIIGNVSGTTIFQLQEIAQAFGLVNATNIDGGASAGIWRNGSLLRQPGRQLASVMYITNSPNARPQIPLTIELTLGGSAVNVPEGIMPMLYEGSTLVPVRFFSESFGAQVEWLSETQTVIISLGEDIVEIVIGQTLPGMNVPAMLIDGSTMIPLRFLAESFGAEVGFDPEARVVSIVN